MTTVTYSAHRHPTISPMTLEIVRPEIIDGRDGLRKTLFFAGSLIHHATTNFDYDPRYHGLVRLGWPPEEIDYRHKSCACFNALFLWVLDLGRLREKEQECMPSDTLQMGTLAGHEAIPLRHGVKHSIHKWTPLT